MEVEGEGEEGEEGKSLLELEEVEGVRQLSGLVLVEGAGAGAGAVYRSEDALEEEVLVLVEVLVEVVREPGGRSGVAAGEQVASSLVEKVVSSLVEKAASSPVGKVEEAKRRVSMEVEEVRADGWEPHSCAVEAVEESHKGVVVASEGPVEVRAPSLRWSK